MHRYGLNRKTVQQIWFSGLAVLSILATVGDLRAETPPKYALADLKALERAFVDLAEQVRPTVVAVRTYQAQKAGNGERPFVLRPFSQGSGFVIDTAGYIATNRHVIDDADVISVILFDGTEHDATIVQTDRRSDLAVLKIDVGGIPAVTFGEGSKLKVNQWVFASGNPFGLANDDGQVSVTYGVVSALGRRMTERLVGATDIEYYGNMIETSAAINPGSSGGALFSLDGELVGVVTAIETASGVSEGHGFAIPMDRNIRRILDTLKKGEVVRYGFLGVTVRDPDPVPSKLVGDGRKHRGAVVDRVSGSNSPAGRAGLKADDIVIGYNGVSVQDSDHLVRLVGFTPVGRTVNVTYLRRGVKREAEVTVGDRFELLSESDRRN